LDTKLILFCVETLSIIYSTCKLLSLLLSDLLFHFCSMIMSWILFFIYVYIIHWWFSSYHLISEKRIISNHTSFIGPSYIYGCMYVFSLIKSVSSSILICYLYDNSSWRPCTTWIYLDSLECKIQWVSYPSWFQLHIHYWVNHWEKN